jgi:hypothetical protein
MKQKTSGAGLFYFLKRWLICSFDGLYIRSYPSAKIQSSAVTIVIAAVTIVISAITIVISEVTIVISAITIVISEVTIVISEVTIVISAVTIVISAVTIVISETTTVKLEKRIEHSAEIKKPARKTGRLTVVSLVYSQILQYYYCITTYTQSLQV